MNQLSSEHSVPISFENAMPDLSRPRLLRVVAFYSDRLPFEYRKEKQGDSAREFVYRNYGFPLQNFPLIILCPRRITTTALVGNEGSPRRRKSHGKLLSRSYCCANIFQTGTVCLVHSFSLLFSAACSSERFRELSSFIPPAGSFLPRAWNFSLVTLAFDGALP